LHYNTHYYRALASLAWQGLGSVALGYEELGSAGGRVGFATPLATLHKFNGWADAFIATPAVGLEDWHLALGAELPLEIKGKLVAHRFFEEHGTDDLGWELDAVLSRKLTENWSVLTKAAYFDGDTGIADVVRFWVETTFQF
jgi:hypothetical protein